MSGKPRIAVWYNLPSGGAKRALYYHVRGLVERGYHVEAWRPPVDQKEFASFAGLIEEHEVPLEILAEGRNYADKILRHVRRPRLLMESMIRHSQECARQIEAAGFDLLFANTCMYFHAPFVGRYVSRMPKCLYLQEPHRPFYEPMPRLPWVALPEETLRGWDPASVKRRTRDRIDVGFARIQAREEQENARSYDRILVNSFFSRESLLRAYGLNSHVCYLGIDTSLFRDLGLPRQPFVIGLGTVGPTKNVRLAIEAVGTMPAPRPPLVWVGNMTDDVYMAEMTTLAASLGVDFQPKVFVKDDELVRLLNEAAAMIYAPRLEPFGLAPLEANACGCPVVAVAEGGVRETIVDGVNGRLVDHDPEQVGAALAAMLADPASAARMGREAKRLVAERWSLESSVDRIERELLATLGRSDGK